jgi:prevent-host-death family protein
LKSSKVKSVKGGRRKRVVRAGRWLLQDAKARFSELARRVHSEGPQHVTVHGRDEVVVISADDANRRAELNDWLAHRVRPMFEQRVLAITEDILLKWRILVEEGRKVGHTFSQPDLIIAATAIHHGLTVVSRDVSDYKKAHAPVFNPWIDSMPTSF